MNKIEYNNQIIKEQEVLVLQREIMLLQAVEYHMLNNDVEESEVAEDFGISLSVLGRARLHFRGDSTKVRQERLKLRHELDRLLIVGVAQGE